MQQGEVAMNKSIVWLQKDFRFHDHPALMAAVERGIVIPVFIWSEEDTEEMGEKEASLWWLYHSILSFQNKLREKGIQLIIRHGDTFAELLDIIHKTHADAVFFHERYEPAFATKNNLISQRLQKKGIHVQAFHGNLLFPPISLLNHNQEPYKIFTAFYNRCKKETVQRPVRMPKKLLGNNDFITTLELNELPLLSTFQWYDKFSDYWNPGEENAINHWQEFSENELLNYKSKRDYPADEIGSKLSAYLSWGDISVKAIWHSANRLMLQFEEEGNEQYREHIEGFLRQLIWREFGYHQLLHFPTMIHTPLRKQFQAFPWKIDEDIFHKWKRGLTGYPLVDAGMRELWETGYMHNRVRMVTASFLIKHLLIPWTKGAEWFAYTLVDYDVANNAMGWQWTAGCGFDAAPYFRIFNPVTQGEKFDERGEYIRKWVPELKDLPAPYIHKPWEAPNEILDTANIILGETYPYPIIEHKFARERALQAYDSIRKA